MSKVAGKVCVVTGGGGGIGEALCESLAASGARGVYVVDIRIESAKAVAEQLPALAVHPDFRSESDVANVGSEEDIKRIIHSAWRTFGTVDVYFSNAGVFKVGGVSEDELSNEYWDEIWRVNVMSHVYAARHLFPMWQRHNRGGTFVLTASAAGLLMQLGALPYHVTKHAAVSVADWLSVAHAERMGWTTNTLLTSSAAELTRKPLAKREAPPNAGLAGLDGIAEPQEVADATIKGIEEGTFLILPHKNVHKYFVRKATDYDRWIKGMRRMKKQFDAL
ncbi:hypothetical protein ACHAXT_004289 [Thalassiosira profunda]